MTTTRDSRHAGDSIRPDILAIELRTAVMRTSRRLASRQAVMFLRRGSTQSWHIFAAAPKPFASWPNGSMFRRRR